MGRRGKRRTIVIMGGILALIIAGAIWYLNSGKSEKSGGVEFQDTAFKKAICTALKKDGTLSQKELDGITKLIIIGDEVAMVNSSNEILVTDEGCEVNGQEVTSIGDIQSLADLANLPNLETLVVACQQIEEFPRIDSETLTTVCIAHNCISDLLPLMGLTNLKELDASYNLILDMSGFTCGENLQSLYLSGNAISSLEFFNTGFSNSTLENLKLDNNVLLDIMPIGYLTGLKTLDLSNNEIENIQFVSPSKGLVSLNISGNRIDNIDIISILDELKQLNASFNNINWLCNVYEGIETINLSNNVFVDGFEADYFPDAVEMSLSFNDITYIIGLSACTKLQKLSIAYTQLSDLSVLAYENQIEFLDISGSQVGSFSELSWCTSLAVLNISDTGFSSAAVLGELQQLQEIYAMAVPDVDNLRSELPAVEVIG